MLKRFWTDSLLSSSPFTEIPIAGPRPLHLLRSVKPELLLNKLYSFHQPDNLPAKQVTTFWYQDKLGLSPPLLLGAWCERVKDILEEGCPNAALLLQAH